MSLHGCIFFRMSCPMHETDVPHVFQYSFQTNTAFSHHPKNSNFETQVIRLHHQHFLLVLSMTKP